MEETKTIEKTRTMKLAHKLYEYYSKENRSRYLLHIMRNDKETIVNVGFLTEKFAIHIDNEECFARLYGVAYATGSIEIPRTIYDLNGRNIFSNIIKTLNEYETKYQRYSAIVNDYESILSSKELSVSSTSEVFAIIEEFDVNLYALKYAIKLATSIDGSVNVLECARLYNSFREKQMPPKDILTLIAYFRENK